MVGMELAETNTGSHRGPRTCASGASQTPFKNTGEAPCFRQTEKGEPRPQSCAQATPLNGDNDNEGQKNCFGGGLSTTSMSKGSLE